MTAGWATILGVGLWMPGFPSAGAWRRGERASGPEAEAPPARLPPRLRRRTSLLIRMVAEVAAQALEQAGVSPRGIPVVVGSAFGEMATTVEMLVEMDGEGTGGGAVSPTRFHNSVHNSAAGYLSIAHGNQAPATSLAAGNQTVAMVLLEALTLLADRGGEVLAIVADEALPASLVSDVGPGAIAAALVLRAGRAGAGAPRPLAFVGELRQLAGGDSARGRAVEVASPVAAILPLIAAIGEGRSGRVELGPSGVPPRWSVACEGVGS
jgi:hypothetical protein